MIEVTRYHDICMGHRVVGHEGKCKNLHGHNYRFYFTVVGKELDDVGRVIDFSIIKSSLCCWLEDNWDHRTIIWEKDPLLGELRAIDNTVVSVPFNPTAENIGLYLIEVVSKNILPLDVILKTVVVEETRKCSATVKVTEGGK